LQSKKGLSIYCEFLLGGSSIGIGMNSIVKRFTRT